MEEICVELLRVLLNKQNSYWIKNFDEYRLNAMTNILVHYPLETAQYLTSQFYERGYTLGQRCDILHVLVLSAQKLSDPNEKPIFDLRLNQIESLKIKNDSKSNENWKETLKNKIQIKRKSRKVFFYSIS